MASGEDGFSEADRLHLSRVGIAPGEAERQLQLLRSAPVFASLDRPCTVGDGLVQLDGDARQRLEALAQPAVAAGRCTWFVPASGAATRMFQELLRYRQAEHGLVRADVEEAAQDGDPSCAAVLELASGLDRLAFGDEVRATLRRARLDPDRIAADGPFEGLLDALLDPSQLDYAALPKALIPFHCRAGGNATAFAEQIADAARLLTDAGGRCRAHFTISAAHRHRFEHLLAQLRSTSPVRLEVTFSTQAPSTDTLAITPDGQLFRDDEGRLLLRPSGHGALLGNLAGADLDIGFLKNIDNVVPARPEDPTGHWVHALLGQLIETQQQCHDLVRKLGPGCDAQVRSAARSLAGSLGYPVASDDPQVLGAVLDRPVRICGMVRNSGEPGGGPFWVQPEPGDGACQIVESAEVDPQDPAQLATFRRATHFNPVFLACGFRDHDGQQFDLERFVRPSAVIRTRKSHAGRALLALERPGLWNGAMAGWLSRFVEVPKTVFNPVKTFADLLRPEHQP